jgi:hypothetical protein
MVRKARIKSDLLVVVNFLDFLDFLAGEANVTNEDNIAQSSQREMVKVRREACESGWYMCDIRRKVPTVGHLGGLVPRDPLSTYTYSADYPEK